METRKEIPIALVGLMGAGKSAVARLLAERLGCRALDLDAMVAAALGLSVTEIFRTQGEAAFRASEAVELARALDSGAGVIACGGGVVLDPALRARLKRCARTVWLEVSPAEALRRIGADAASRPLLDGGRPVDVLAGLLAARAPLYREVSGHVVATDGMSIEDVTRAVARALGLETAARRDAGAS